MRDVVIVGAARTAIGSFLGSLSAVPAPKLGATAITAAVERAGLQPGDIQLVHMGEVLQAGVGQAPACQAAKFAGLPDSVPCVTVNKVCGSGLEAVLGVARAIAAGEIEIGVAGGQESMSNAPHIIRGLRGGVKMGALDTVAGKKGDVQVVDDEEPGRGAIDKLPSLRASFQKDGTVTAGNASSLNDGAAAVVLMSADEAKKRGLKPLAKLVAWGYHAQAPEWFTTAPAPAIQNALKKAGWDAKKVDLWEINEAFAVVSIANNQLLGIDPNKVNIRGGAVALGHPIGASGARLLVTLVHAMADKTVKTGGASQCIGRGEGIAHLEERV